jgi:hypothetical protein
MIVISGRPVIPMPDTLIYSTVGGAGMRAPREIDAGSAAIDLPRAVVAGSYQRFCLTYTAGFHGIDDSGSIKICFRFATDQGSPQFDNPEKENYVSAESSSGAGLELRYDRKLNVRPWGKTIHIRVRNGFLGEGDTISVHFGGNPGFRMQTFCEETFEFKVLADPIATCVYTEVNRSPETAIVAGPAATWRAMIPSICGIGEEFTLKIAAEDAWGNPTDPKREELSLEANLPLDNLPAGVVPEGVKSGAYVIDGIVPKKAGTCVISGTGAAGASFATNPMRIVSEKGLRRYWGDMHGQSEETIGTNSVDDYFAFARDSAGLDFASHQGNDFQITSEFWRRLQKTTAEFNRDGEFVTFPGFEWSGNTSLGGDHNVYYLREGETIHRSSHALVAETSDLDTDRSTVAELLDTLAGSDAMVCAHVGGRYAALDGTRNTGVASVELHSAWGTFEWLLRDAFDAGLRVGVVCNSDGHKGRPGASYPGASMFGSYGGLTCVLAEALSRDAIWGAYRARRHYGTTGARIYLDVIAETQGASAPMGAVLETRDTAVDVSVDLSPTAPIVRVELINGGEIVAVTRPATAGTGTRRILVTWSGAAFRGRGRLSDWSGYMELADASIREVTPFNRYNHLLPFEWNGGNRISWQSYTTGGIAGCIVALTGTVGTELIFRTTHASFEVSLASIEEKPFVRRAGGLDRIVRIEELPSIDHRKDLTFRHKVPLVSGRDNPIYVKVVQEDGHMAWSSPIYIRRR